MSATYADDSKANEEFGSRENRGESCASRLSRQPTQWETYLEEKSRLTDPATRYIPLRGKLVFTYGLLFVCIFLMTQSCIVERGIAPWAVNRLLGPSPATLLRVGAPRGDEIRETGEWWRLLWGPFLHAGWLHILMNFLVWYQLGVMIEPDWGFLRTFVVFMLSAITGSLMSATLSPAYISVGASGGIFGIMGACIPYVFEYWRTIPFPKCILYIMIVSLILSFVTGFVPYVDNYAHLGGAIGGVLSGFMTITKFEFGSSETKNDGGDADKAALKSGELASSRLILADSDLRRGLTCMGRDGSYETFVLSRGNATLTGGGVKNSVGDSKVERLDSSLVPSRLYEQGGGLVRSGQLIPRPRSGMLRKQTSLCASAPVGSGTAGVQKGLGIGDRTRGPVGVGQSVNAEPHCFSSPPSQLNGLHPSRTRDTVMPITSRSENLVAYRGKNQKSGQMASFSNVPAVTRPASELLLRSMDEEVGMAHIGNGVRSEVEPQLGRCYEEPVGLFSSSVSVTGAGERSLCNAWSRDIADSLHSGALYGDVPVSSCSKESLQHSELHCVVPISGFVRKSGSLRRRTSSVPRLALRVSSPSAPQALVLSHDEAVVGSTWDGSAIEWNSASTGREETIPEKNTKEKHSEICVVQGRWPSSSGSLCLESSCRLCVQDSSAREAERPASRLQVATATHTMDYPADLALPEPVSRGADKDNKDFEEDGSQAHDHAQEGVHTGTFEIDIERDKSTPCVDQRLCSEPDGVRSIASDHSSPYSSLPGSSKSLVMVSEAHDDFRRSSWGRQQFQTPSATATPDVRTPRVATNGDPAAAFSATTQETVPDSNQPQSRRASQAEDTLLYRLVTSERLMLTDQNEAVVRECALPEPAPSGVQTKDKAVGTRDSNTVLDGLQVLTPRVSFNPVVERSASGPKSTASTRDEEPTVLQSAFSRQFSKGVPNRPKTSAVQKDSGRRWKRLVHKMQKRFWAVDEKGCPKLPERMTVRHTSNVDIDDSFVWKSWKVWCIRLGSGAVLAVIWAVLIVLLGCPSCYTPPGRLSFA